MSATIASITAALTLPLAPVPNFSLDLENIWAPDFSQFPAWHLEGEQRALPLRKQVTEGDTFAQAEVNHRITEAAILALAGLEDNWDGHGGVRPNDVAISEALAFLAKLPGNAAIPSIEPANDGEVNFVWRTGGSYLEVGFDGDGVASFLARDFASGTRHFDEFVASKIPDSIIPFMGNSISAALPV